MRFKGRDIDHIVYCVPNLEEAIDHIDNVLGCRPQIGGKHVNNGTKNALLNLGNQCYFEILAIDEDIKNFGGARWMGIDMITKPRITRWALKSEDIQADKNILSLYNHNLCHESQGERVTDEDTILNWKMLVPQSSPLVELAPFFLDWSDSDQHPTAMLQEECSLEYIEFKKTKENTKIQSCFNALFTEYTFDESDQDHILISIKGPKGTLQL